MKGNITYILIVLFCSLGCLSYAQDVPVSEVDTTIITEYDSTDLPMGNINIDTTDRPRKFREDFDAKYRTKEFEYKEKDEKEKSAFEKFLESLFNDDKSSSPGISGAALKFFFYLLIALVLGYAVYILIMIILGKKGAWLFYKKSDELGVFYGDDEAEILDADYPLMISKAVLDGDYRLAVRYQYLLTLQKLASHNIIVLHQDKTNSDYKYEIKDRKLRDAFSYISYIYDYTWYGAFDMNDNEYSMATRAFDDTTNIIAHG